MNVLAALRRLGRGLRALRGLPAVLRLYGRGLALVIVSAPLAGGTYLVLLAVLSLLPVLQVWLAKLLLDAIAAGASGDQEAVGGAVTLAVVYALTLVVPAGLRPVHAALSSWLQDRSVVEVDRRLMQAGARLVDLYRIERPAFHDEVTMARRGITVGRGDPQNAAPDRRHPADTGGVIDPARPAPSPPAPCAGSS